MGFGLSIQYIEATLGSQIDSALACIGEGTSGAACAVTYGLTVGNANVDSSQELKGDDISYGMNFGVLFENDTSRVGFSYRSQIEHKLTGTVDFTLSPALQNFLTTTSNAAFQDTGANAGITLPDMMSLSYVQELGPKWTLLADATWTDWSDVQTVTVKFNNPVQDDSQLELKFRDTMRYSVGATYRPNSRWEYKTGIAYDEGAVKKDEDRSARIPDSDRVWLTLGLAYKPSDDMIFDIGYAHIFVSDSTINNTHPSFGHTLNGTYESDVNILGAQLTWNI